MLVEFTLRNFCSFRVYWENKLHAWRSIDKYISRKGWRN